MNRLINIKSGIDGYYCERCDTFREKADGATCNCGGKRRLWAVLYLVWMVPLTVLVFLKMVGYFG